MIIERKEGRTKGWELPRAKRPLLILIPSVSVSPVAFVFVTLSVPAKSTKWNLDDVTTSTRRSFTFVCVTPLDEVVEEGPPVDVVIFK